MPDTTRLRLDYMPGAAALAALDRAASFFPSLARQALIDRLVICGLSALEHTHWQPPTLLGSNRDRWRLPGKRGPDTVQRAKPTGSAGAPLRSPVASSSGWTCRRIDVPPQDLFLTPEKAAQLLALPESTLAQRLPAVQFGSAVLYRAADVAAAADRRECP